jgi:hypothetical protein
MNRRVHDFLIVVGEMYTPSRDSHIIAHLAKQVKKEQESLSE